MVIKLVVRMVSEMAAGLMCACGSKPQDYEEEEEELRGGG